MEEQHLWCSLPSYLSVLCALPCSFAELPPLSVGEGGAVQVVAVPRSGRGMWLEAGRAPARLYAIPAGGTASSLQGQAGALTLAKGEGRDQTRVKVSNTSRDARENASQGQQHEQRCKGEMHHGQRGAGSVQLGEDAVNVGLASHRQKTGLFSPWETRHPSGSKTLFRSYFRGESAKLEGNEVWHGQKTCNEG